MKKIYFQRFIFLLISLLFIGCNPSKTGVSKVEENYVLFVSFDGFRHDYAEKYNLPNFKKLAKEGATTPMLLSSFPSKTFPNHYSLITGMYPGNHGIVDNKFYDRGRDAVYAIGDRAKVQDAHYYQGYPLWQWLQSKGMKTASYFWVGSEAPIRGEYPTYYYDYDGKVSNEARIDEVARWFQLPKNERPRFVTLYFSLVDTEGHNSGPNSPKMRETVQEADRLLGLIMQKVKDINLPIYTIVVSDHGMIEMDSSQDIFINLEEVIKATKDKANIISNGMHAQVYVNNPADKAEVYNLLKAELPAKVKIYYREQTPAHWHYSKSSQIGDIILVVDAPNYMIHRANHPLTRLKNKWGTHGYDPYVTPDMGGIFYAIGPKIKKGYKVHTFENVNVYPLITRILGVDNPENIDGKPEVLAPILK
ncbi:ectonucleotide pyrophosphatase/phosphodiesterase [Capnocytophaga canis]|uniref:alkaline phosphatase family protein n=1 Tax=Capnocytophaga TaxID=1016 RepID=UPI000BB1D347|nr:ectonucleotide pyrophosphatase/phosphodiesterase [Capnocytophaga sp. H4358]ATA72372.1 alkaline phosphatase family protein [Capnocytophaga sp. H4358]